MRRDKPCCTYTVFGFYCKILLILSVIMMLLDAVPGASKPANESVNCRSAFLDWRFNVLKLTQCSDVP